MSLSVDFIAEQLLKNFEGLKVVNAWGEKSFFYNPDGLLKRGVYFCTIKEKDGENDTASELNREGIFRINFGLPRDSFIRKFGDVPGRPQKGGVIEGGYDFTQFDLLTPHPVYGWMSWVAILNPSKSSWVNLQLLLKESYLITLEKYKKRIA
jgi:hypothetical protein